MLHCYMVAVLRGFSLFFPAIFFAVFSLFIIIIIKNEVISNYGCVCVCSFSVLMLMIIIRLVEEAGRGQREVSRGCSHS